jgi:hypothetical protein
MGRWGAAFRAAGGARSYADTPDTMDTQRHNGHATRADNDPVTDPPIVSIVSNVSGGSEPAKGMVPARPRPVPIRPPPGLSAEDRDGLIAAALLRPTSWADPAEALKAMGIAPPPKFPDDFGKNGGA